MAKRKRSKRIDYGPSKKKMADVETKKQMRAKFPEDLVSAFVAICEADWEDNSLYKKYKKLEVAHLGESAADPITQGKLIVQLSRATSDIVQKGMICSEHPKYKAIRKPKADCKRCWDIYNAKKKAKEKEAKETKKLGSTSSVVQAVGSDAQQKEGEAAETSEKES